eukprot:scaffold133690_cov32-Tisochrysis_lutea.AAC.1
MIGNWSRRDRKSLQSSVATRGTVTPGGNRDSASVMLALSRSKAPDSMVSVRQMRRSGRAQARLRPNQPVPAPSSTTVAP